MSADDATGNRRGSSWRRLGGGLCIFLTVVGCQRIGPEPPPAPPGAEGAPVLTDPVRPGLLEVDRPPPGQLPDPAFLEGIDVILHARVARDPVIQERTAFWIEFWTGTSRDYFERYLERMGHYGIIVDEGLESRRMPESLRYLPIVESGYHHGVTSHAGATGLWQLMPPTARGLGLLVDGLVDDRRDPVIATRAALDYLTELHDQFDSWFLALAAYNAGPGRVGGILRQHAPDEAMPGDERYLRIRPHLPAETREFVPRFLAAAALASDPERFGFAPIEDGDPFRFDEVLVPDATSLDVIALAAETSEEEIQRLNPHYLRGFTPAGVERVVRVPAGVGEKFTANYALIPPGERVSFMEHAVASGETLTHIARRYGVTLSDLNGANRGLDPRRLQIGQRIVVPVGSGGAEGARLALARAGALPAGSADPATTATETEVAAAAREASSATELSEDGGPTADGVGANTVARLHVVASGENLWTISRQHGVGVAQLRRWNGLAESTVIQPGQELVVGEGVRMHRVQRGETWSGIARRYGVATAELARVNGRTVRDVIRAGEEVRIPES